jgi:hypothetical protein
MNPRARLAERKEFGVDLLTLVALLAEIHSALSDYSIKAIDAAQAGHGLLLVGE